MRIKDANVETQAVMLTLKHKLCLAALLTVYVLSVLPAHGMNADLCFGEGIRLVIGDSEHCHSEEPTHLTLVRGKDAENCCVDIALCGEVVDHHKQDLRKRQAAWKIPCARGSAYSFALQPVCDRCRRLASLPPIPLPESYFLTTVKLRL